MRKPKNKQERIRAAKDALDKTLRKNGIDPSKRPILRGVQSKVLSEAYTATYPAHKTSDLIPAHGPYRYVPDYTGDRVVGQLGNKQGFGLLKVSELGNAARRDR